MVCEHGNLLTLGCCTSWSKVGQATCQNTDGQNKAMCLKKAIYGLKQAALAWWRVLDKSMSSLGCTQVLSDSGLFVNEDKTIVIIVAMDLQWLTSLMGQPTRRISHNPWAADVS